MPTDWLTAGSSLATAGGTLILAVATFVSVRSANRSARLAERTLQAGLRPLLIGSRFADPEQKIGFYDDVFVRLPGGYGSALVGDNAIYLTMSVRNGGAGLAVLDGWSLSVDAFDQQMPDPGEFHRLTRDILVAPNDVGFWQGALRDPSDPQFEALAERIKGEQRFAINVLYGDWEGGQRTVTRFSLQHARDDLWLVSATRHWTLDRPSPR